MACFVKLVKLHISCQCFAILLTLLIPHVVGDGICGDTTKGPDLVPDPDKCDGFYVCHSGIKFRFSCASKFGPKKVFDPKSKNCVLRGSKYDNSRCKKAPSIKQAPSCTPGLYQTFPDEKNCAKYFQCSGHSKPVHMECPYPRLYDINTRQCRIYLAVKCGARKEPKDPCDYASNQCDGSGCIPCRARFGTCIGHRNGPNAWDEKPWTPHFVMCKDERVILHGDCRQGNTLSIFNPYTRQCTPISQLLRLVTRPKKTT